MTRPLLPWLCATLLLASPWPGIAQESPVSLPELENPKPEGFLYRLRFPLVTPGRTLLLTDVPVWMMQGDPVEVARVFQEPVFAASAVEAERKVDTNFISLTGLRLTAKPTVPDREYLFQIDVSQARPLKGSRVTIHQIVTALVMSLRELYPFYYDRDSAVTVQIVGAMDPTAWESLNGLLWRKE